MLGMIKMLPLILVLAGSAWGYHTVTVSRLETAIAQLEADKVTLKNNQIRLETALETEQTSREQAEQNLQTQLKAVGELTEKNTAMQAEMDDYLSIFRRHNLTKLARLRPGMIEPRINNGTSEVFRSIEADSQEVQNADSQ
jgi:hypothetical protein